MTIETTSGLAGFSYWTTEAEVPALGEAFFDAAYRFFQPAMGERKARTAYSSALDENEIRLKH